MSDVRTLLKKRPLLFDGGMGTYYKGAPGRECEQANRLDPEGIRAVHRAYLAAGADAIKTNTFGLPRMAADDAVRFLTDQLGYGKYLDKNGMDRAKLAVLEMLGAQEPTPRRLLRRLAELRTIVQEHVTPPGCKFLLSTIHSAKGLEYDRVILLDVLDGILPAKPELCCRTPGETQQYEEDRRLFYVAMTRAKEKLCLVMTARDPQAALTKHAATLDNEPTLPAHTLLSAGSMGDWLMMAALRHPSGGFFRKLAGEEALSPLPAATTWQMEIVPSPAPAQAEESSSSVPADPALVEEIDRRIGYQYPFAALTEVPSKLAASALSHRALAVDHIAEQRPAFWEKQPLSAAERGTAMHAFMEHADFGRARTDLRQEADRLLNAGVLNADQRAALRLPLLGRFFDSELCARMLRTAR